MQHIQQMNSLTEPHTSFPRLRVTTTQPSGWERLSTQMRETGLQETLTESVLILTTFSLVGGFLFSLYRALEHFTIIPLP